MVRPSQPGERQCGATRAVIEQVDWPCEVKFCVVEYGIDFPIFSKIVVIGEGQHPLYSYLTEQPGVEGDLKWNGVKFLVNRKGAVVARFDSWTNPDDPAVTALIEKLLGQAGE